MASEEASSKAPYYFAASLSELQKTGKKRASKNYNPDEVGEDETCIICYARCKNIIFRKCKHMIVCDRCMNDPVNPIKQCPYCRENVEDDYIKVVEYIPKEK